MNTPSTPEDDADVTADQPLESGESATRPLDDLIDDSLQDADFEAAAEPIFEPEEVFAGAGVGAAAGSTGGPGPSGPLPGGLGAPTLPPPPMRFAAPRKLVRDPYSRLGGVCSGLAHYFGFDVVLVRIVVLLGALLTGGVGFPAYLIGWIFIPRATMWPPVGPDGRVGTGRSVFSNRQVGIGIAFLAALVLLFVTDSTLQVLVPLLLMAGGVWLLRQPPRTETSQPPAPRTPASGGPSSAAASTAPNYQPPAPTGTPAYPPAYSYPPATASQPVPKRSGGRRLVRGLVILPFLLIPVIAVGGIITAIALDGLDVNGSNQRFIPYAAEDLPTEHTSSVGGVSLDLSYLTNESFFRGPQTTALTMDVGSIRVLVPNGLDVAVTARTDVGDIKVFDQQLDGLDNELILPNDNAVLTLDLAADVGEISVVRVEPKDVADLPNWQTQRGEVLIPIDPIDLVDPPDPEEVVRREANVEIGPLDFSWSSGDNPDATEIQQQVDALEAQQRELDESRDRLQQQLDAEQLRLEEMEESLLAELDRVGG